MRECLSANWMFAIHVTDSLCVLMQWMYKTKTGVNNTALSQCTFKQRIRSEFHTGCLRCLLEYIDADDDHCHFAHKCSLSASLFRTGKVIIAFETNSCVKKVYFRYIKSTHTIPQNSLGITYPPLAFLSAAARSRKMDDLRRKIFKPITKFLKCYWSYSVAPEVVNDFPYLALIE